MRGTENHRKITSTKILYRVFFQARRHDAEKPKFLDQVRGADGAKLNGAGSAGRVQVHAIPQKQTSRGHVVRRYDELSKRRGIAQTGRPQFERRSTDCSDKKGQGQG